MKKEQTKNANANLVNKLVSDFYEEYASRNGKFLLFELANANENANTKVLKSLLQYNKCQFLNPFLERVGLHVPQNLDSVGITDQKQAIGVEGSGFIDLYVHYDEVHVIIENKIYGAGDTGKQLARYIATVEEVKKEDFEEWYNEWGKTPTPNISKNIHVFYLTADGTKEPLEESLPPRLKNAINYYAINYADDILPWLEEDVLPHLPYGADGMMIAGVQQYIAYLKQLLSDETSEVVESFVKGLQGNDYKKYQTLLDAIKYIKENEKAEKESVLKSLRKQLGAHAEAIFTADAEGEWELRFTPSFILLYKKSWAALDTRKYSIPSLYLHAGNQFLKNGCLNNLKLCVDHLSSAAKEKYPGYARLFGNHDKTFAFDLQPENVSDIPCVDINNKEERKEYYKKVITRYSRVITDIDRAVAQLQSHDTTLKPNDILDKIVEVFKS